MRIGIDVCLLSKQLTGLGNYTGALVSLLPTVAPQHEYFLYSNREFRLEFTDAAPVRKRLDSRFRAWPGSLWLLARCGSLIKKDDLDVFWASGTILPTGIPAQVRKIVTVHDLVWLRCPETTTRYNLLIQKLCARRAIASADSIVVVSRSTQDELIQTLGVPSEKTKLVYPGVYSRYKAQDPAAAAEYISRKYGVPERYLATVGIVHPRKNMRLLVETLRILKRRGQLACPLLIGGPMGWKNSDLFRDIRRAGLTDDDIRFLGYLPSDDMPLFYGGAQLFLFPSLYEGFGAPPVEAMACGAPVIASNAQCMPEILGGAAILESPTDAEGFAAAISSVLADNGLRESMRAAGPVRAKRYRYEDSVKHLIELFEETSRPWRTPGKLEFVTDRMSTP
jgi:glycosyltransferase involved in cell wall biosynthesis